MAFTVTKLQQHSQGDLRGASARLTFGKLAGESLADPSLVSTTLWAGATDWSDTIAGSTSYLHSGGTGTLTQTSANMVIAGSNSKRYKFTYTIDSINIAGALTLSITTAFGGSAVVLPIATTGTFTVEFVSDASASSADFVLAATSTTALDAFTLSAFSLVEVSDYPVGGEALTPNMLGLGEFVGDVVLPQGQDGLTYHWDRVAQTIVVMAQSIPQLIVSEVVTVTTDVGTLAYPPAYINSVAVSGTGQVYEIIGANGVPGDNTTVAVNFTTGVMTFHADDNPANVHVTYFPQRPGTFFSKENLVIDEVITPSATPVNLDFRAAAIQYVYGDTTDILFDYTTVGTAPIALSTTVDMLIAAGTTLDFHADEVSSETTVTVTYLKAAGLDGNVAFIDQVELDASNNTAEAFNFTLDVLTGVFPLGDDDLIVPGQGTRLVAEAAGDAVENAVISDYKDTAADIIATWNPRTNNLVSQSTTAIVEFENSYLKVKRNSGSGLAEISANQDLTGVSIDVYVRGR